MKEALTIKEINSLTVDWLFSNFFIKKEMDPAGLMKHLNSNGAGDYFWNDLYGYAAFAIEEYNKAKEIAMQTEDQDAARIVFKETLSTLAARFENQMIDHMFDSLRDRG